MAKAQETDEFLKRKALIMEAVDLYQVSLRNYVHSMTRNFHDAENIMQELWVFVFRHFSEADITNFNFLRRKAYQLYVDHWRRKKRKAETDLEEIEYTLETPPYDESLTEEDEKRFKEKFWSGFPHVDLTNEQKDALWLKARFGYTIEEISEMTGKPSSTIGDWIKRSRSELKKYLSR